MNKLVIIGDVKVDGEPIRNGLVIECGTREEARAAMLSGAVAFESFGSPQPEMVVGPGAVLASEEGQEIVAEARKEADTLRQFAQWVLRTLWDGFPMDFDVQDKALEMGLIKEVEMAEPCADDCPCVDFYETGESFTCHRFTELLDPATNKAAFDEIREKFGRYFSD